MGMQTHHIALLGGIGRYQLGSGLPPSSPALGMQTHHIALLGGIRRYQLGFEIIRDVTVEAAGVGASGQVGSVLVRTLSRVWTPVNDNQPSAWVDVNDTQ